MIHPEIKQLPDLVWHDELISSRTKYHPIFLSISLSVESRKVWNVPHYPHYTSRFSPSHWTKLHKLCCGMLYIVACSVIHTMCIPIYKVLLTYVHLHLALDF